MRAKKLAIIVSNKQGVCYQVLLTDEEMNTITNLIIQLHNGKIMAMKDKLSIKLEKLA